MQTYPGRKLLCRPVTAPDTVLLPGPCGEQRPLALVGGSKDRSMIEVFKYVRYDVRMTEALKGSKLKTKVQPLSLLRLSLRGLIHSS